MLTNYFVLLTFIWQKLMWVLVLPVREVKRLGHGVLHLFNISS